MVFLGQTAEAFVALSETEQHLVAIRAMSQLIFFDPVPAASEAVIAAAKKQLLGPGPGLSAPAALFALRSRRNDLSPCSRDPDAMAKLLFKLSCFVAAWTGE